MTERITILAEGLKFPEGPVVLPDGSLIYANIGKSRRAYGIRGAIRLPEPDMRSCSGGIWKSSAPPPASWPRFRSPSAVTHPGQPPEITGASDMFSMGCHCGTHIDSLSHKALGLPRHRRHRIRHAPPMSTCPAKGRLRRMRN